MTTGRRGLPPLGPAHEHGAVELRILQRQGDHIVDAQLCHSGHEGHAQTRGYSTGHHLFRVHLLDNVGGELKPAEDVVYPVPGPAVIGIGDHGLPNQILELHTPAQSQGMAAGDHGDDLLVKNVKYSSWSLSIRAPNPRSRVRLAKGVNDLCRLLFTELKLDGPVVLIFVKALDHIGDKRLLTV